MGTGVPKVPRHDPSSPRGDVEDVGGGGVPSQVSPTDPVPPRSGAETSGRGGFTGKEGPDRPLPTCVVQV